MLMKNQNRNCRQFLYRQYRQLLKNGVSDRKWQKSLIIFVPRLRPRWANRKRVRCSKPLSPLPLIWEWNEQIRGPFLYEQNYRGSLLEHASSHSIEANTLNRIFIRHTLTGIVNVFKHLQISISGSWAVITAKVSKSVVEISDGFSPHVWFHMREKDCNNTGPLFSTGSLQFKLLCRARLSQRLLVAFIKESTLIMFAVCSPKNNHS